MGTRFIADLILDATQELAFNFIALLIPHAVLALF